MMASCSYHFLSTDRLAFGDSAKDSPGIPFLPIRQLNWFSKCVKKIDESLISTAIVVKIFIVFALTVSVIGIPVLFLWKEGYEQNKLEKKLIELALRELNISDEKKALKQFNAINQQWFTRAKIIEDLQVSNFEHLPILNLPETVEIKNGYLRALEPTEIANPLMRGILPDKRPFLALKLKDQNHIPFVVTLFQRYTLEEEVNRDTQKQDALWVWQVSSDAKNHGEKIGSTTIVDPSVKMVLRTIIQQNNPNFSLAN